MHVTAAEPLFVKTLAKLNPLAAVGLTVIVVEPVTVGEVAEAVSVFDPAAYRVADNDVVLTPLVNDTFPGLGVGYVGAMPAGLVFAPLHVMLWIPV